MDDMITLHTKKYSLQKRFNIITEKQIVFRHGHIAITDYHMGDNREFEKSLSVFDEMNWKYELIGGYYVKELKEFRVNRGYNTGLLSKFFKGYKVVVDNDSYPCDKVKNELYAEPKSDFQRVALTFMACQGDYKGNVRYTQQMIDADTGDGKEMPNYTLIPTPTGFKRLGDLKVGDKVFNVDGYPVKVLAIYPHEGLHDVYELTFKDGRKTRCNPEHLWYVIDPDNRGRVLPLYEILKNYIRSSSKNHIGHRYAVPIPGAVQYKSQNIPVDPYVLGALIGNGCLTEKALTISSGNMNVPAEVAKIIKHSAVFHNDFNVSYKFLISKYVDKNGRPRKQYVQTKKFLKDLPELIGSTSGNKFIPDIYKYNSIEVRQSLLQGLMDTDGHISNDKYKTMYSTTSTKLKDDIVELVRSLGYLAFVTEDKRHDKYKSKRCYRINIVCPDSDKSSLFRANKRSMKRALIASEFYQTRRRDNVMSIIDIKKVEPAEQRCILIDDPRHLYLADQFIPTHNTYCGVASSCFLSARTVIIMPFTKLIEQWKASYLNFTSIKENEIMVVQGSKACHKIIEGKCKDIKIFLFMADTIDSFCKRYGNLETIELFRATNAYTKIIDEVHRDMKTISMIEALTNFKMNFYMSASPGRSGDKENWIFKSLFNNIPRFGSNFKLQSEKHIAIMIAKYSFLPTNEQLRKMINRRQKWLNSKCYESELIQSPTIQREDFESIFLKMLSWSKTQLKSENKILILMSTIDGTAYVQNLAEKIFPGETSRYYGTMGKDEDKKKALEKRIICATGSALGTGADIQGIQHVYNCITYSNWIDATQLPGRARKLKDNTQVVYVEFVNFSFDKTVKQFMKRKPYLENKSKSGRLISIN